MVDSLTQLIARKEPKYQLNFKLIKYYFRMFFGTLVMVILYLILQYTLAWIRYFNSLDTRLGDSTWRWSYDYQVVGKRDISDLDDKSFIRLRRKKNKIITFMYSIVMIMFIASMSLLSKFMLFFIN